MSTADDRPGGDAGGEPTPPIWGDVTEGQPERDVPQAPADAYAVPPPAPGAPIPPPAQQPEAPAQPYQEQPVAPQGPPAGQAPYAPQAPQFVRPGQAPQPPYPSQPYGQDHPARPVFVNPDQPPYGQPPTFVRPGGQPIQPQPGGAHFVQPGGGPVYSGGPGAPTGNPAQPVHGGPLFVQPNPQPSPVDLDQPWKWWLGPVTFGAAIAALFVLAILFVPLVAIFGSDAIEDNAGIAGLFQDAMWVGVVLLIPYWAVKHLRAEQLGLKKAPIGRSLGVLVAAFVAFLALSALYAAVFSVQESDNTLLQDTGFGDSVFKDVLLALVFTVAAPVAEELLFRSLLFRTIRDGLTNAWGRGWGLAAGALISGVIFGGVHLGGGQDAFLPVLMLFGVVLALAYHWSGTIYVPIALHSINNALATGSTADSVGPGIYVLIVLGPVIALLTAYGISKAIPKMFRAEPPEPPAPYAPPTFQDPARL